LSWVVSAKRFAEASLRNFAARVLQTAVGVKTYAYESRTREVTLLPEFQEFVQKAEAVPGDIVRDKRWLSDQRHKLQRQANSRQKSRLMKKFRGLADQLLQLATLKELIEALKEEQVRTVLES
jgi:hypothetical protein